MEATATNPKTKAKKVTKNEIAYAKEIISYAKQLFERVNMLAKSTDTVILDSILESIKKGEQLDDMINLIGLSNTHDVVINQFRTALIEFEQRIAMELANVILLHTRDQYECLWSKTMSFFIMLPWASDL